MTLSAYKEEQQHTLHRSRGRATYAAVDATRVAAVPAWTVTRRADRPLSAGTAVAGTPLSIGHNRTPTRHACLGRFAGHSRVAE